MQHLARRSTLAAIAVCALAVFGGLASAPDEARANGTYAGSYEVGCWGHDRTVYYVYYSWQYGYHFHSVRAGRC